MAWSSANSLAPAIGSTHHKGRTALFCSTPTLYPCPTPLPPTSLPPRPAHPHQMLLQVTGGRNGYGVKLANIFSMKLNPVSLPHTISMLQPPPPHLPHPRTPPIHAPASITGGCNGYGVKLASIFGTTLTPPHPHHQVCQQTTRSRSLNSMGPLPTCCRSLVDATAMAPSWPTSSARNSQWRRVMAAGSDASCRPSATT